MVIRFQVILLILLTFMAISGPTIAAEDIKPLYMVLLIDASGSMKNTDPNDLRIMAAQTVLAFMTGEDRAAVVEFSNDARILSGFRSGSEKDKLFDAAARARKNGGFTDFRIGLEAVAKVFDEAPDNARKAVLLLTDGRFEPSLGSDDYAPYYLQYRKDIAGKKGKEKIEVQERYRTKLLPVARRMIDADILPGLRESGIEVYSVSLGAKADDEFLGYITSATNLNPGEIHMFRATEASELTESFLQILKYTRNNMLIHRAGGNLTPSGRSGSLKVDAYLEDALCIAYSNHPFEMKLQAVDGTGAVTIAGTHPDLKIASLPDTAEGLIWNYDLRGDSGEYLLLAVGQSTLQVEVVGLKHRYLFSEVARADILLVVDGQDARGYLNDSSSVTVKVDGASSREWELPLSDQGFGFDFEPPAPGSYNVYFEVDAKDRRTGQDLLPRSSKHHEFKVMPGFLILEEGMDFGDLGRGKSGTRHVKVVTGLSGRSELTYRMRLTATSSDVPIDSSERVPVIAEGQLEVRGSGTSKVPINLEIPKNCTWGDFEGVVEFQMAGYGTREVPFRVHVPSIWEKLAFPIILLLLLLILVLVLLVIAWGRLGTPVGTLTPLEVPDGETLEVIRIGRIRQGLLARTLNFKKNVVSFSRTGANVKLRSLSPSLRMELRFFRFGGNYVVNCSPEQSGGVISIETDLIPLDRRPGQSSNLRHDMKIRIGDYLFVYKNF